MCLGCDFEVSETSDVSVYQPLILLPALGVERSEWPWVGSSGKLIGLDQE